MKRLAFIPEIFIWLAFSVVAGFGYAFSFFEYVASKSHMETMDIIVPTLVWVLLAAICTLLLRVAQKTKCFVQLSKAEGLFLECSILALLLVGGWIFRFVDYFHGVWPVELDNVYFQYAQVSQNMEAYLNPHPASRLYVAFLHVICLFFGNIYEIGAFVQFVLLLVAVVVWYGAIRKAFGVVSALFFVAGAMLLPDSIITSMQCNPMMLLFVIYGCISFLLVKYAVSAQKGFCLHAEEVILGAFVCIGALLDVTGVLLLAAFLVAIAVRLAKAKACSKFVTILSSIIGLALGGGLFMFVQAEIYGIRVEESLLFGAYSELTFVLPGMDDVRAFLFSLGTHPVFIVSIVVISIYWFLSKKQAITWIMFSILYLFALQLLKWDMNLQYNFMIYMGISVLLGISIQQILLPEEKRVVQAAQQTGKASIKEEPVVTVIRFEDEPAVTVPEKSLIFIPKTMEIPKRVSKPKIDFALEVKDENMHYDYNVDDASEFDI